MTAKTIDILLHILVVALVLVLLYRGYYPGPARSQRPEPR
ncbi:hypothetical protein E308F_01030 [Moorella sp. E308F]|nr:hypothetical protein E308F_01030 [Moorella sp. E308F]